MSFQGFEATLLGRLVQMTSKKNQKARAFLIAGLFLDLSAFLEDNLAKILDESD